MSNHKRPTTQLEVTSIGTALTAALDVICKGADIDTVVTKLAEGGASWDRSIDAGGPLYSWAMRRFPQLEEDEIEVERDVIKRGKKVTTIGVAVVHDDELLWHADAVPATVRKIDADWDSGALEFCPFPDQMPEFDDEQDELDAIADRYDDQRSKECA